MANPNTADVQRTTVKSIWEHYRAQAKTSRRLKAEQGSWRRMLLLGTVIALLLTPFSKTFDKLDLHGLSFALTVAATVLFSLMAWLHKEVLGEDSEQPWVRTRQTGEGLKALAFRFLGGVTPFDTVGAELALKQAQTLVEKAGVAPDSVEAQEAQEKLPAVPLAIEDYVKVRVDDQINFYSTAIERARKENARIVAIGRSISAAVVIFGALGAVIAKDWRDIWAPALGAAATLATAQNARAHHRFLIDSYSTATAKLKFAKTRWEVSPKSPAHDNQLIETVEAVLAAENAGWVQQMLLKPIVPDSSQQQTS